MVHRQRVQHASAIFKCAVQRRRVGCSQDHVMAQHHPLGPARGARSVQNVAIRVGLACFLRRAQNFLVDVISQGFESVDAAEARVPSLLNRAYDDFAQCRQRHGGAISPTGRQCVEVIDIVMFAKALHGQQQDRVGLVDDVSQLLPAKIEINWDRDRADARDRELQRDELGIIGHEQGNMITALHAPREQSLSEAARPVLHSGIGPTALLVDEHGAVRKASDRVIERDGQGSLRPGREALGQGSPTRCDVGHDRHSILVRAANARLRISTARSVPTGSSARKYRRFPPR